MDIPSASYEDTTLTKCGYPTWCDPLTDMSGIKGCPVLLRNAATSSMLPSAQNVSHFWGHFSGMSAKFIVTSVVTRGVGR